MSLCPFIVYGKSLDFALLPEIIVPLLLGTRTSVGEQQYSIHIIIFPDNAHYLTAHKLLIGHDIIMKQQKSSMALASYSGPSGES